VKSLYRSRALLPSRPDREEGYWPEMALLWAAVTRGTTVLAECGEDHRAGAVVGLAKKILRKRPSPGWEFERANGVRAAKFHVHCADSGGGAPIVFAICCVFDQSYPEVQAKGFCEKMAFLTEPLRNNPQWTHGGTLACQESFAPTLMQRMEQANSAGKTAMVSSKVDEVKNIMAENIELLLERGDKLEELDDKASTLGKMSLAFRKQATNAKRFQMWQQAKMGMAVGTAVTVGVAAVVVPTLIVAL